MPLPTQLTILHTLRAFRTKLAIAINPLRERRTLQASAPGIVGLALFPLLAVLVRLELNEPLFGDTLVFQYTAWCVRHGMKLYRDIGMADGPFIHYLQAGIQSIVGAEDLSFRKADLFLHATLAGTMGALLAPNFCLAPIARGAQRLAWAALASSIWLSWYLSLDWTTTTEREAFYTLFGSLGTVLLYVSSDFAPSTSQTLAFLGGLVVTTQAFGKPTGVVYVLSGGTIIMLTDSRDLRRAAIRAFAVGALTCVVLVVLALLLFGSISGYFFWCVKIPYYGNRFLFGIERLPLLFANTEPTPTVRTAATIALVGGVVAVASSLLPRRALPLAVAPSLFFLGFCLQARGYTYQAIPVIGATLVLLLAVLSGSQRSTKPGWTDKRGALSAALMVYAASLALDWINKSPYRWNGDKDAWTATPHDFAVAEHKVGMFLREKTKPDDRLFVYSAGENAHVVLLTARRRTVSPFFHSFWLDPVGLLPQSPIKPNETQLADLENLQTEVRSIACSAVENGRPKAMAFNLLDQVFKVCPNIRAMLALQYDGPLTKEGYSIYFRKAETPDESNPASRAP